MKTALLFIVLGAVFYFNFYYQGEKIPEPVPVFPENPFIGEFYDNLKDTLFYEGDTYLEIDLETQMAYLHRRNGKTKEFPVSTGTKRLKDGVETKEGLFAIQYMSPRQLSRQFDDAVMLHWMGFNYGIGFHGLLGSRYYQYLGKKPSSHGCIRTGREDIAEVFKEVSVGTPVLVHRGGNNAVTIGFTDNKIQYTTYSYYDMRKVLEKRYNALYSGMYFLEVNEKIKLERQSNAHPGLPIGEKSKIPLKQVQYQITTISIPSDRDLLNPHRFLLLNDINFAKKLRSDLPV